MSRILVVGAGFAGSVYARVLAENGFRVTVIDRRPHIGGNCYDYVHECGIRVHQYGPHLFHTSNKDVVAWLSRFTEWVDYSHRVVARLPDSTLVPLPVNRTTINRTFGLNLKTDSDVKSFLDSVSVKRVTLRSAEDWLINNIGPDLTNLYFRPYTKKMWSMDLCDMNASVVQRIQIRTDEEDRYFPSDTFQAMPKYGYTSLFERILDHDNIDVYVNTEFDKKMLGEYSFCFNSMPIDVFFESKFGDLPYRSIRFHTSLENSDGAPDHTTINYTDLSPYTRETWWHNIPNHRVKETGWVVKTIEEPCDYIDNNHERYYPIKLSDDRLETLYARYKAEADREINIRFIGRCGTYQYLDMHQVINQSLNGVEKWIRANPRS